MLCCKGYRYVVTKKKFFGPYVFYKFENETKEGSLKMFDLKMLFFLNNNEILLLQYLHVSTVIITHHNKYFRIMK